MSTRFKNYIKGSSEKNTLHSILCLKQDTGYSLFLKMIGNNLNNYTPVSNIYEDSWSEELPLLSNTGRYDRVDFDDYDTNFSSYSLPSSELFDSPLLSNTSEIRAMLNPADLMQQTPMSGRMTPQYQTQDSNLETRPSSATTKSIGTQHGSPQNEENSTKSPQMCASTPTTHSVELPRTTWSPSRWKEWCTFSGAKRELESPVVRGMKPDSRLIQRFLRQSSGTDTANTKTLSWMNSPVKSASSTYSAGVTDTPLPWKQKEAQQYSRQEKFGSPATLTQDNGIQPRQNLKRKLCFDDLQ